MDERKGPHDSGVISSDGWVEGPIVLDQVNYNYDRRHYVRDIAVHAGAGIQVKFGDGWISGRYEWSFDINSPIRIHRRDDVLYINEGHIVRIQA